MEIRAVAHESREPTTNDGTRLVATIVAGCTLAAVGAVAMAAAVLRLAAAVGFGP